MCCSDDGRVRMCSAARLNLVRTLLHYSGVSTQTCKAKTETSMDLKIKQNCDGIISLTSCAICRIAGLPHPRRKFRYALDD
jgi:hypothetical protein